MFGKLGRSGGAGRGSGKKTLQIRPNEVGGSRVPIGASAPARGRPVLQTVAGAALGREETFNLEPGKLEFGAIIRLTPDIVEEIRRLEAQGGSARIKFDANANNSAGNVVEVGGKEFRFTWSQELPELCNIYEECRNGDDGDGLLVECGAAWRKLNVQRILDESTKNQVKMRSEEAERMLKARKAIVLDPTNPSVKSQAKSMAAAAVEGNMRRMGWKHKKEFFKKRKVENSQGVASVSQTKSVSKSAMTSNGNLKCIPSPIPSPQQPRSRTLLSTSVIGNVARGDANLGEIAPPLNLNKEEIDIFDKEKPAKVARGCIQDINGYEGGHIDPSINLRKMLITLLTQNPKGMSLKALEKAVGERFPKSVKKIEIVLKNIAIFQAPGRYFLKQGGQVDSSKRNFEVGSSPECLNKQTTRPAAVLSEKAIAESLDQETLSSNNGEGSELFERIDIINDTEDPLNIEGRTKGNNVVRASSSGGSDSDSESDSTSDTASQSRSRSKSRSPVESSSGSSSSESDVSSSSKEASDIDVDIMISDDEKEIATQRIDATMSKLPSPFVLRSGGEHDINDSIERDQEGNNGSPALDLTNFDGMQEMGNSVVDAKNLLIDRSAKLSEKLEKKTIQSMDSFLQPSKSSSSVNGKQFLKDPKKVLENSNASPFVNSHNDDKFFGRKTFNERQDVMNNETCERTDNRERVHKASKKRSSNSDYQQEKPENAKRMKGLSSVETSFGKEKGSLSSENLYSFSPERSRQMDQKLKMTNNHQKYEKREINLLQGSVPSGGVDRMQSSPNFTGAAKLAEDQSNRKAADSSGSGRKKNFDAEKPTKYAESLGRANKSLQTVCAPPESDTFVLKSMPVDRISTVKVKADENGDTSDKYRAKIGKEIFAGEKTLSAPDQINRKSSDDYTSQMSNAEVNGRGNFLRRELSDLELGEFREPLTDGMGEDKRHFETKNSKKMENRVTDSEANVADINRGKGNGDAFSESKRQSPNSFREVMNGKVSRSQQSSRIDDAEPETMVHLDNCVESGAKNGTASDQLIGSENEAGGPKKSGATKIPRDDKRHNSLVDRNKVKESKSQKSNGFKGSLDKGVDVFLTYNDIDGKKSFEFSSDEENGIFIKYEKDELAVRSRIMDFSMYKDYVREFQERYSHYCYLNKKLENNRNAFIKVGDNIDLARGRDMGEYYNLVEKLRQMYHQHGERHKEMKRIFILLHEDLKNLKQRIKDFAEVHSRG